MKSVAITGATGFVGANLARRLLAEGHKVNLLVRRNYGQWRVREIAGDVEIHIVDLLDGEGLAKTVAAIRPEWIFHLSVYGAYSEQGDLQQMISTNISATANLLQACLQVGFATFVNAGSSSEYGFKEGAPNEDDRLDPNSYYACTKAAAAHLCGHIARAHGVYVPTLRLYSAYGPYEEPTRLIPTLIRFLMRGQWPPLVAPETARDFVYIDDVCEAFVLAAARADGEFDAVYNVGSGVQTTLAEVVEAARRLLPITGEPEWASMPGRQWDTRHWCADISKIERELHWRPRSDFTAGLRRSIEWFAAHGDVVPEVG